MGPFQLSDFVGLDTLLFVLEGWQKSYPDVQIFQVPALLRSLNDAGALGNKSGGGFFVDGQPNPAFFDARGMLKK